MNGKQKKNKIDAEFFLYSNFFAIWCSLTLRNIIALCNNTHGEQELENFWHFDYDIEIDIYKSVQQFSMERNFCVLTTSMGMLSLSKYQSGTIKIKISKSYLM